ncbi:unnamed protein product, partial [Nesidiocoris tenuis]
MLIRRQFMQRVFPPTPVDPALAKPNLTTPKQTGSRYRLHNENLFEESFETSYNQVSQSSSLSEVKTDGESRSRKTQVCTSLLCECCESEEPIPTDRQAVVGARLAEDARGPNRSWNGSLERTSGAVSSRCLPAVLVWKCVLHELKHKLMSYHETGRRTQSDDCTLLDNDRSSGVDCAGRLATTCTADNMCPPLL